MYHRKVWHAGVSVAVHNSHSPRMGRALVKADACRRSRAAVEAYNHKLAERRLALLLNENFLPGDGHVVLGYWKDFRVTAQEGAAIWREFMKNLRGAAKAAGVPLKYVHALAVGERGALHHHMILNREALGLVKGLWAHGGVNLAFLYDKRNYQKLAKYFCGQEKGWSDEEGKNLPAIVIHGNKYSSSRNLVRPEPEPSVVEGEAWEKYPAPEEGYVIDPDSLDAGKNPVSGKPYQFYIMLPVEAPRGLSDKKKADWCERARVMNAAEVRWKMDKLYAEMERKELLWRGREEDPFGLAEVRLVK
ncbi:hypothetical protein LJB76_02850 [Clostridia bacterium OttesenSCG-928-O13]|nr:hypothetical protein [Clostridia bacterium OttesenSCG-928-O13]